MAERPLAGRRIAVTRPREQTDELVEGLEHRGALVVAHPLIAIVPPPDPAPLGAAVSEIERYDWVVFTSVNGVFALRGLVTDLGGSRVAAVGPATAAAAHRELGVEPAFVPERYAAQDIAIGLEPLRGMHVLLPQADIADPALAEELRRRNALVDAVTAYRTVEVEQSQAALADLRAADAVVLMSGSAARSLAAQGGAADTLVVCIGPRTANVARRTGLEVGLIAREATAEGIIQALVSHFQEV